MTLPGYHDTMDISSQTSRFIAAHRNQDVRDLALSAKRVDGLDLPFVVFLCNIYKSAFSASWLST